MEVQTGVFIPGTYFYEPQIEFIVGVQWPAILKGAYSGAKGVKQRVIIVENEAIKEEFKKLLLSPSTYNSRVTPDIIGSEIHENTMVMLGRQLALSGRIVTLAERKEKCINLEKLYVDIITQVPGSKTYLAYYRKQSICKAASVDGLMMGAMAATMAVGSLDSWPLSIKVAAVSGVLGFIGGAIHQWLKPEIETISFDWQELSSVFVEHDLYCRDIRILGNHSGDRVNLYDVTSASDRRRARNDSSGHLAADEQLAEHLRSLPQKGKFERVSGYQGLINVDGGGSHIARHGYDYYINPRLVYKTIRQKQARVTTLV